MVAEWFANLSPRNDWETEFVEGLRHGAAAWPDIAPEDATAYEWRPLAFVIEVPQVPRRSLVLDVWSAGTSANAARWFGPDRLLIAGPTMRGFWDRGHFEDDLDERDPEILVVKGVEASPGQYAEFASDWVRHQLSRPLALLEWPGLRRWVFEDTNMVLWQEGRTWFRRPSLDDARRTLLRGRAEHDGQGHGVG